VLKVTCTDGGEFSVKIVRLADPTKDDDEFEEGDPPWQQPAEPSEDPSQ
jgi:hypothetical protein